MNRNRWLEAGALALLGVCIGCVPLLAAEEGLLQKLNPFHKTTTPARAKSRITDQPESKSWLPSLSLTKKSSQVPAHTATTKRSTSSSGSILTGVKHTLMPWTKDSKPSSHSNSHSTSSSKSIWSPASWFRGSAKDPKSSQPQTVSEFIGEKRPGF